MHNLEIFNIEAGKFADPLKGLEVCCTFGDKVFTIYDDTNEIFLSVRSAPDYKIACTITLPKAGFYCMAPLELEQKLFVCNTSKILCYSTSLVLEEQMELDEDILTAKWNPTNDLFAILHVSGKVALYSMDVNIGQLYLVASSMDVNPLENVDIGWGTSRSSKPLGDYKCADLTPYIDWKENSELFCISVITDEGDRAIHVYNQQCEFLYKTEGKIQGLESKVAFKPVGNMIACVVSETGVDQTVAFIEKNGELRFELPMMTKGKILEIQWSPCSLCLAIHQKDDLDEWVDLYLSVNFVFHLKQRLRISKRNKLQTMKFRKVLPNMFSLQLFLIDGLYTYRFVRKISRSFNFEGDKGTTSVISGKKVVTYFYKEGITSPDSEVGHCTYENKCPINAIIFAQHQHKFAVVDCENNVHIIDYSNTDNCERKIVFNTGRGELDIPLSYYLYYFDLNDHFVAIGTDAGSSKDVAYKFYLNEDMVTKSDKLDVPKQVVCAAYESKNSVDPTVITASSHKIPIFYIYIMNIENTSYVIHIDAMGSISVNNVAIGGTYTSLFCNREFLMVTKNRPEEAEIPTDKLISVQITKKNMAKIVAEKLFECCAYQRSIEQGATIVNSVENTPIVILYMPRGNLETIEVRNVAILKIKEYLDENNFKEALDCINQYSLKLDLLFDLDPHKFLNAKETIFKLLEKTGNLQKFLTELREENSLDRDDFPYISIATILNRKQRIATAFESVFLTFAQPQHNLPILTLATYFNTKSVEKTIQKLSQTARTLRALSSYIIQSLNLLARHIEHRQLYNAALSCFDIKMAEMVARRSQMDPRIYEAFLFRIRGMDIIHQRFTILNELGNFKRAVQYYLFMHRKNIVTDEALITYACEKNVIEALYFYCHFSDMIFRMVAEVYLTELGGQHRYKDIAIVSNRLGKFNDAVNAFLRVGMWHEAIAVIHSNLMPLEERRGLTRIVASYLRENRNFAEAASIFLQLGQDVQAALQCYMDGHLYAEALKLTYDEHNGRLEMIVVESMRYYCLQLTTKVEQMRLEYINHLERLTQVRNEKLLVNPADEPHDELYSDLESTFSASTTRSTTSSRSNRSVARRQRKEERKFLNPKKGSKYEDIAIMVEMHNIATKNATIFKEIDTLYMSLMIRDFTCEHMNAVQTLHIQISDFQRLISDTSEEVWRSDFTAYVPKPDDRGAYENVALLECKYRMKPAPFIPAASFPDYRTDDLPA